MSIDLTSKLAGWLCCLGIRYGMIRYLLGRMYSSWLRYAHLGFGVPGPRSHSVEVLCTLLMLGSTACSDANTLGLDPSRIESSSRFPHSAAAGNSLSNAGSSILIPAKVASLLQYLQKNFSSFCIFAMNASSACLLLIRSGITRTEKYICYCESIYVSLQALHEYVLGLL